MEVVSSTAMICSGGWVAPWMVALLASKQQQRIRRCMRRALCSLSNDVKAVEMDLCFLHHILVLRWKLFLTLL